jgi:hypothetical protein
MSQFDWSITKKRVETMETPQNKKILWKDGVPPPLWPTYIDEKGRNLGKTIGD